MDFLDHVEDYAKELAGNWKKFDCFYWRAQPEEGGDDWCIIYTSTRDTADCLTLSNEAVIIRELEKFEDDFTQESHNHWAVGYVNGFSLRVRDAEGNITEAFKKYCELRLAMESYPVLDEGDWCEREYEAQCEAIEHSRPHWAEVDSLPEDWVEQVRSWLNEHDPGELEDTSEGIWVSEKKVGEVLEELGLVSEDEDEDSE